MTTDAPYPFPGMNPYFESWWFEVHPMMIVYARNQMQQQMPYGLRVSIEHGMTISGRPPLEDDDRQPDVSVWKLREDTLLSAAPANYAPPVCVVIAEPKPRHLVIREAHDGSLVTVIEFISPGNKRGGGVIAYAQKRLGIISAGVSFVEVDLVRKWGLALVQFEDDCVIERMRDSEGRLPAHAVTVVRASQIAQREIYPVSYSKSLPACRVPLRPDDSDIWLNLQALAEQCHRDGAFDKATDYTRDPEPPLSPEDAIWLDQHLKSKRLR